MVEASILIPLADIAANGVISGVCHVIDTGDKKCHVSIQDEGLIW